MNFSEKLITLRKQQGWSQEELAQRLDVSRQSVSKWESGQSAPDLPRLIAISELFGVSCDYLVKEGSEVLVDRPARRLVTLEQAQSYLKLCAQSAWRQALAALLCIYSPIPLLALNALRQEDLHLLTISDNAAGSLGMIFLMTMVAVACGLFLHHSFQERPYAFLSREDFDTQYGVAAHVRQVQEQLLPGYSRCNLIGTVLCVLSVIPLFIAAFFGGEGAAILGVCVLLLLVGIGVVFFVLGSARWSATEKLLQEGDYTCVNKRVNEKAEVFTGIYWLLATAIYLTWSFTVNFSVSWILWPISAVFYAAFLLVLKQALRHGYSQKQNG